MFRITNLKLFRILYDFNAIRNDHWQKNLNFFFFCEIKIVVIEVKTNLKAIEFALFEMLKRKSLVYCSSNMMT